MVKTIKTEIAGKLQAREAGNSIIQALRRGEQAAVIYPLVTAAAAKPRADSAEPESEEDAASRAAKADAESKRAVASAAGNWVKYVPEDQIAVLHGKMTDDEKRDVLAAFRAGTKRLMLASTVIEVGVTLPDLKTMMVLQADRFGVMTLHQLRGRLARNGGEGHFILYTQSDDAEVMERLQLLVDNQDGFDLAEKDAEIRGYGDILGDSDDAQSGTTRFLFHGVKVGPREIAVAHDLLEKAIAANAAELSEAQARRSHVLRA